MTMPNHGFCSTDYFSWTVEQLTEGNNGRKNNLPLAWVLGKSGGSVLRSPLAVGG